MSVNLAGYDVIAVGTPTWWYTMAPAVKTFLHRNDFARKTVVPFMTNGGWLRHVIEDMKKVKLRLGRRAARPCFKKGAYPYVEYVTLSNGVKVLQLGYGVYQIPAEGTKRCVLDAIDGGATVSYFYGPLKP